MKIENQKRKSFFRRSLTNLISASKFVYNQFKLPKYLFFTKFNYLNFYSIPSEVEIRTVFTENKYHTCLVFMYKVRNLEKKVF